jgi:hypothetical protein
MSKTVKVVYVTNSTPEPQKIFFAGECFVVPLGKHTVDELEDLWFWESHAVRKADPAATVKAIIQHGVGQNRFLETGYDVVPVDDAEDEASPSGDVGTSPLVDTAAAPTPATSSPKPARIAPPVKVKKVGAK